MTSDFYPECDGCGQPLHGDYEVRRHEIEHPVKEGYWNPLTPDTWVHVAFGDDNEVYIERTCDECEPSNEPPKPGEKRHKVHAGGLLVAVSICSLATSPAATAVGVLFGLGFIGEVLQMGRTRPDVKEAREEFLAGEIDEDELEAQIEDELEDTRSTEREIRR